MGGTDTRDKIDRELTRTYFSGSIPDRRAQDRRTPPASKKRPWRSLPGMAVTLFLVAALIAAVYFLMTNRVSFSLDIRIEPQTKLRAPTQPAQGSPLSAVKEALRLPEKIYTAPRKINATAPKDKVLYTFDDNLEGWEISSWSVDKPDHVGRELKISKHAAAAGAAGAEMRVEFPGVMWSGAIAEVQRYIDLSDYAAISADIYLPPDAPVSLRGKIIITAGDDWRFIEMTRGIKLTPGVWTTITADLSDGSSDWKRMKMDASIRSDVRKMAIRIESSKAPYAGPVYIDNIRVSNN
jgi:hypothetical protein